MLSSVLITVALVDVAAALMVVVAARTRQHINHHGAHATLSHCPPPPLLTALLCAQSGAILSPIPRCKALLSSTNPPMPANMPAPVGSPFSLSQMVDPLGHLVSMLTIRDAEVIPKTVTSARLRDRSEEGLALCGRQGEGRKKEC